MSELSVTDLSEQALADARALRTEAWSLVRQDVARLRDGLHEKPIAQRIKDRATEQAVGAMDEAVAVASDNKALIGVSAAALLGWLFRGPLWKAVQDYLPRELPDWVPTKGD